MNQFPAVAPDLSTVHHGWSQARHLVQQGDLRCWNDFECFFLLNNGRTTFWCYFLLVKFGGSYGRLKTPGWTWVGPEVWRDHGEAQGTFFVFRFTGYIWLL